MDLRKRFGQSLKSLRGLAGMTQASLAEAAGVAEQYLGRIERGLVSPSFDVITRLAQTLDIDPAFFFLEAEAAGSRAAVPKGGEAGSLAGEGRGALDSWLASARENMQDFVRRQAGELGRAAMRLQVEAAERARLEADLEDSRKWLPDLLDGICDGFLALASDDMIVEISSEALEGIGRDRNRTLGCSLWEVYPPLRITDFPKVLAQVRRTGEVAGYTEFFEPNGRWYHAKVLPLGEVVVVTYWDVTALRETKKSLAATERLFASVAERLDDMIWMLDTDFAFTYMSPGGTRMLGYSIEELLGEPVGKVITPNGMSTITQAAITRRAKEAEGIRDHVGRFEVEMVTKSGETFWGEVSSQALYDERGVKTGYMGVTRDVTKRRLSQESLHQWERRYRSLFRQSLQGILLAKEDSTILDANPAAEELLCCPLGELLGQKALDLVHPEDLAARDQSEIVRRVWDGETVAFVERCLARGRGYRSFYSKVSLYDKAEGRVQVVFTPAPPAGSECGS